MDLKEQELREKTNPVFNTAKATLLHLAEIGDEDARVFAGKMGIDLSSEFNREQQKSAMTTGNLAVLEARYESMNRFIESSDAGTIVDLPCGYTPRALRAKLADRHYIGCDLPAVIDEIGPMALEVLKERGSRAQAEFHAVDATNYASLREALQNVNGEVCITTEGLMMYFNDSELRELFEQTGFDQILNIV